MKKALKLFFTCLLCFLGVVILYGLYAIVYPWVTEYNPEETTVIIEDQSMKKLSSTQTYSILTWNIGYAGLGREMDFFYEGGKMVRPTKEQTEKYLNGITSFLKQHDSIDFMLLQEVDFRSKRSYKVDQYAVIREVLPGYTASSATNYKSAFVPSPLSEPMGSVHAGQATFGRYGPANAYRMSTPGTYAWPMRLFMLKRCFLISRYALENDKFIVLFNIHNSAFDDAGDLREQELKLLRKMAIEEYEKGNYVVIGGDWNQNPPGWVPQATGKYQLKALWPIDMDYMPDTWGWAFDPALPTNRSVTEPFQLEKTSCTSLDYFLTSPNVSIEKINVIDLGFEYSDHQPVLMKFRLHF